LAAGTGCTDEGKFDFGLVEADPRANGNHAVTLALFDA
jgi:hypothetical protein